jgi:thiamine-phosphate pyrophosphorylase
MLRYAITDRSLWTGAEREKQEALVRQAARWAQRGIDFVQLREKDLPDEALATLARNILKAIQPSGTRLLINSNLEVALHVVAHGVHLTSAPGSVAPEEIRRRYLKADLASPVITVSCHTIAEIEQARAGRVDAILFAPVFEKTIHSELVTPGQGLEALRAACAAAGPVPVCALGGVTFENADLCLRAGAAGIAGIRLFHDLS